MTKSKRVLSVTTERLRLAAPFRISGYVFEHSDVIVATVSEGGQTGRGEAAGVYYLGDDVAHMIAEIETFRGAIEKGADRAEIQRLMPPGGARNALDCALWELEAAQAGRPAWQLAGVNVPQPLVTTFTIGADEPGIMADVARGYEKARAIKLKLTGEIGIDVERVQAVREARPDVWLGVDANQGFNRSGLEWLVEAMVEQRVSLLEQPLARGREADLEGFKSAVPIAADESALTLADVPGLVGRFDVVNIKLDKCGGLTEGLAMAAEARRLGLGVMVGNMVGTSLAMAPAFILGQLCDYVDLDGPTFLAEDRTPSVTYADGQVDCGGEVWGGGWKAAAGMNHVTGAEGAPEKTWFGQPRGLTVLFMTNMWETFSYYGMRALLVYYMTRELLIGQEFSSTIYSLYTGFAYFTPIIGGTIADRWLGKRRAVIIGASVMAAGHFMMAFEPAFYFALATIALGNGLFLPTLPSQVNDLYRAGDPRRSWAYNIYYVGVNVGGVLGMLICGFLGETIGWHWGFGAAGIGMLAGLAIYLAGGKYLPPESRAPAPATAIASAPAARRYDWTTIQLLLGIGLAVTVFRGAYEQVGNTVALWADSGVDRVIGGMTIPGSLFQSLNPLLVILMTPLLLIRWRRLADAGREHNPLQKMAIGASIVAVSYALLALAAVLAGDGRAHWAWLVGFFVIFTLGELYILPTGLGLFARLAPQRLGATTVASWFLASFAGALAAGQVGRLWSHMSHASFFVLLAIIATAAAGFLLLLDRPARRVVEARTAEENIAVAP